MTGLDYLPIHEQVAETYEINPSAVLVAMGVPGDIAAGAIRLSLGRSTTTEQIVTAAVALTRAAGMGHPTH